MIEIGGSLAGDEFDQFNVVRETFLDGVLSVDLINGFVPNLGDTFSIFQFGAFVRYFRRTGDSFPALAWIRMGCELCR